MSENGERFVFVRALIMDELPSGQVQVAIYAGNADGIRFYTEPKHVLTEEQIASNYNFALQGQKIREAMQYLDGVFSLMATSTDEGEKRLAKALLPRIRKTLYPFRDNYACFFKPQTEFTEKEAPEDVWVNQNTQGDCENDSNNN